MLWLNVISKLLSTPLLGLSKLRMVLGKCFKMIDGVYFQLMFENQIVETNWREWQENSSMSIRFYNAREKVMEKWDSKHEWSKWVWGTVDGVSERTHWSFYDKQWSWAGILNTRKIGGYWETQCGRMGLWQWRVSAVECTFCIMELYPVTPHTYHTYLSRSERSKTVRHYLSVVVGGNLL